MRILWLKTELLHPVDKGGKIRTYEMLREIARRHEVTYLTLVSPSDSSESFERATEYCRTLVPVELDPPRKYSGAFYRDLALDVASPVPYAVGRYRSDEMRRAIARELAWSHYDVVVSDFLVPTINLPSDLDVPVVLFQHNVETLIWRRHFENASGAKRAFFWLQYLKMRSYERRACRRVDAVVAVSAEDREIMRDQFGVERIRDVSTGVDAEFFRPQGADVRPNEIVFTGSMDWMPNEDAILYFAREVLPIVAADVPDVHMTVVGRDPTPALKALGAADPRIEITGRVDDIRPYVDRAAAYVVPIRVGGGTRLKIYEAMAMEKAVVSTTIGAEGLPVTDGEQIVLADTPVDMGREIVRLLGDRDRATRIGRSARSLVCERFSWSRAAADFVRACEEAVDARSAGAFAERGVPRGRGSDPIDRTRVA